MMTEKRQEKLRTMIQCSRARLMVDYPEFALVLMYLRYVATKQVYRISTNGRMIYFDPDWLQKLTAREMDYILVHQAMHFVKGDISRPAFFAGDRYHHACDIILNSLMRRVGFREEKLPHVGQLPHTTYFPAREGCYLTPVEAFHGIPFDPALMKPAQQRFFRIDSDEWWGHTGMPEDGTMILYPGYEGLSFEVIREKKRRRSFLRPKYQERNANNENKAKENDEKVECGGESNNGESDMENSGKSDAEYNVDSAAEVDDGENDEEALESALNRLMNAVKSMEFDVSGRMEDLERTLKLGKEAKLDWRKLLNTFLQEEIHDYSFLPPDRRFSDSGFFLPDFNDRDEAIRNVLFLIDSSGSVEDDMISAVYGEICGAIEQLETVSGMLSFFNTDVTPPMPFCTVSELQRIRPTGYGGTDFDCIFRYVQAHMEEPPSCIVIFTDGIGVYPSEEAAAGIPVLWILHGGAAFPNWGQTARLT